MSEKLEIGNVDWGDNECTAVELRSPRGRVGILYGQEGAELARRVAHMDELIEAAQELLREFGYAIDRRDQARLRAILAKIGGGE